ncbi:DUF4245 family protein [Nocardioides sp.]|uniref:DUF4245 family protein n=1 Tax=Nocardioides sp. TaxID=35761 RepID=UPI003784B2D2
MSEGSDTGRPGRRTTSLAGLIGAMLLLLVVLGSCQLLHGVLSDQPEYQPDDVDYRELVVSVQQLGVQVVHPPSLPDGWTTKAASFDPGERPAVDLVFTTDDAHTAGIHQSDTPTRELLDTYVGEGASESGDTLSTAVGTWTGWDDTDADHAWTTDVGDDTVLVYSSGDADALRTFVESLTTATVPPSSPSPQG